MFVIIIFEAEVYCKRNLKSTVSNSSTDSEFMAVFSGAKSAKHASYTLEDLVFSRQVPTKLFCDNTAEIMMEKYNKPIERCSDKLHLQSYLEILWSKTGYFGLLGKNYI